MKKPVEIDEGIHAMKKDMTTPTPSIVPDRDGIPMMVPNKTPRTEVVKRRQFIQEIDPDGPMNAGDYADLLAEAIEISEGLERDLAAAQEALKNHLHLDNHNAIVRQLEERAQRAEALAESNAREAQRLRRLVEATEINASSFTWRRSGHTLDEVIADIDAILGLPADALDAAIAGEKP